MRETSSAQEELYTELRQARLGVGFSLTYSKVSCDNSHFPTGWTWLRKYSFPCQHCDGHLRAIVKTKKWSQGTFKVKRKSGKVFRETISPHFYINVNRRCTALKQNAYFSINNSTGWHMPFIIFIASTCFTLINILRSWLF